MVADGRDLVAGRRQKTIAWQIVFHGGLFIGQYALLLLAIQFVSSSRTPTRNRDTTILQVWKLLLEIAACE